MPCPECGSDSAELLKQSCNDETEYETYLCWDCDCEWEWEMTRTITKHGKETKEKEEE